MKSMHKILIVVLLGAAIAGALVLKARDTAPNDADGPEKGASGPVNAQAPGETVEAASPKPAAAPAKSLPRLVDLGAKECIPCKMMAPILEELKKEYAGKMDVLFIDVRENPEAG